MSKIFVLVIYAFGQPNPVITQEFHSKESCEHKAYFINRKDDQYSAMCYPKDLVESV